MQSLFLLDFPDRAAANRGEFYLSEGGGHIVGLPGIWVLAAVIVGGGLFGIFGMLLGVPVAATIYSC